MATALSRRLIRLEAEARTRAELAKPKLTPKITSPEQGMIDGLLFMSQYFLDLGWSQLPDDYREKATIDRVRWWLDETYKYKDDPVFHTARHSQPWNEEEWVVCRGRGYRFLTHDANGVALAEDRYAVSDWICVPPDQMGPPPQIEQK
jgi:hypothetical protein